MGILSSCQNRSSGRETRWISPQTVATRKASSVPRHEPGAIASQKTSDCRLLGDLFHASFEFLERMVSEHRGLTRAGFSVDLLTMRQSGHLPTMRPTFRSTATPASDCLFGANKSSARQHSCRRDSWHLLEDFVLHNSRPRRSVSSTTRTYHCPREPSEAPATVAAASASLISSAHETRSA